MVAIMRLYLIDILRPLQQAALRNVLCGERSNAFRSRQFQPNEMTG